MQIRIFKRIRLIGQIRFQGINTYHKFVGLCQFTSAQFACTLLEGKVKFKGFDTHCEWVLQHKKREHNKKKARYVNLHIPQQLYIFSLIILRNSL